ncbi:hypothetical protein FRC03_001534 [Tulasnella sp. 419]|nr:hypothetical protein FRC03_001534 [Tulasnella sp. 419]
MPGFFEVIAHVMRNHAKTQPPIDGQLLKDVILSDTVTKLTERVDQNFTKILTSLQQFVEIVHHQNYEPRLMQDFATATSALARIAADPQSVGFDPDPWIAMCMTVIQHNKASSRDLIVAIDALLKAALLRFEVKQETLEKLFQVMGSFYRRDNVGPGVGPPSHVVATVLATSADSLKGRNRATPATATVMLKTIMNVLRNNPMMFPADTWSKLGIDSLHLLQSPSVSGGFSEENLTSLLAAAECVHEAMARNAGFLYRHFLSSDRSHKAMAPVRAWNALALAALSSASITPTTNLLINLSAFSLSYTKSLLALASNSNILDSAALEVNRAVIAAKLWMMMCKKKSETLVTSGGYDDDQPIIVDTRKGSTDESANWEMAVWNELWPPFEAVLTETMPDGSEEVTPYYLAIWTSLADLVLFIHQLRSPIALEKSVIHGSILRNLLRRSRNESANNKFNRALKCVTEPPPEVALEILIAQTRAELLASEKLTTALESRKTAAERVEKKHFDRRGMNRTVG